MRPGPITCTRSAAASTVMGTMVSVGMGVDWSNGGRCTTRCMAGGASGHGAGTPAGHGWGPVATHVRPLVVSARSLRVQGPGG